MAGRRLFPFVGLRNDFDGLFLLHKAFEIISRFKGVCLGI